MLQASIAEKCGDNYVCEESHRSISLGKAEAAVKHARRLAEPAKLTGWFHLAQC